MADSEYNMDIYKSGKISIGTVMRNPEKLKLVPHYLKTKKMCKHAVKKFTIWYVTRYFPDQYKTQQMCDKAILENGGTLESVPDCYKNQQMCDKAVDNYLHALKFAPDCYMTQDMCDEAGNTDHSTIQFVRD